MLRFFVSLRAGAAVGRASRYERQGRKLDALNEYKRGLSLLSVAHATRDEIEACSFAGFVVDIERLAPQLDQPGASVEDLRAAVRFIEQYRAKVGPVSEDFFKWLPHLQERVRCAGGAG
jgi:hypothetical protein